MRSWMLVSAGLALSVCGSAWARQAADVAAGSSAAAQPAQAVDNGKLFAIDPGSSPIAALLEELGPEVRQYHAHVITLSNPFFEGREPGSNGNKVAGDYVEFYMRQTGLVPSFPSEPVDGGEASSGVAHASYRQPFKLQSGGRSRDLITAKSRLARYTVNGNEFTLAPNDYGALAYSSNTYTTAPLVFVGYSLPEKKEDYTSYPENLRLDGKIALILRFEPMDDEGKSKFVDRGWSPSAGLEPKVEAAFNRGAAGVILVNAPGAKDSRANKLIPLENSDLPEEPFDGPVIMMSTEAADALITAADAQQRTLMDLRKLADASGVIIDLPRASVTIGAELERTPIVGQNISGILPGKGALANEYIVIGAHYDHVGYGFTGGSTDRDGAGKVHPGADDNGSGTAGLLLLMDLMKEKYAQLPAGSSARSIIFAAFDAEEQGLLGSRHMAKNMPVPIEKVALMLNMDMIGRLYEKTRAGDPQPLEVSGVDTGEGMEAWVKPIVDATGLNIKIGNKSNDSQMLFARSDHFSFYQQKIPVMFFFTGLHNDYHSPRDVGSKINSPGAVRVIHLVRDVALAAAAKPDRFVYTTRSSSSSTNKPAAAAQPDPAADAHAAAAADPNAQPGSGSITGTKVRFGIMPGDYSGQSKGVLIGDVYDNTSAADAGLKAGDLMTKWNDSMLESVEQWMQFLSTAKVGDEVTVTYVREGKENTTKVKLKARESREPR